MEALEFEKKQVAVDVATRLTENALGVGVLNGDSESVNNFWKSVYDSILLKLVEGE